MSIDLSTKIIAHCVHSLTILSANIECIIYTDNGKNH